MTTWEAGPELDADVAQAIFGEQVGQYESEEGIRRFLQSHGLVRDLPPFSTELAAAWTVVEGLRAGGYLVRVVEHPDPGRDDAARYRTWLAQRSECTIERTVRGVRRREMAQAGTVPLAICRAALAIVAPRR
jgi:hypothetical protein